MITIALDAMSGDNGLDTTIVASIQALKKYPKLQIIMVGIKDEIQANLSNVPQRMQIQHASEIVTMNDSPALAMRNKKDSSMRVALELVKSGAASAVVSAGNTGALMATSRYVLKMLAGISRPVLCVALPGEKGPVWMLDLGANIDSKPEQLLQFGLMGNALATVLLHRQPVVGLLNVGSEEMKGNEIIKKAAELLKSSEINYFGFVEGDDILKSVVDLVVCDGFVGNVALKSAEGITQQINSFLKTEFTKNWWRKLVALLALPIINALKHRFDERKYNGASLLGLNGVVIKSHGGTDAEGMLAAITVAYQEIENNLLNQIKQELANSNVK